ncbi:unnamed protein product [Gordionus sp. m RMFG-2023]
MTRINKIIPNLLDNLPPPQQMSRKLEAQFTRLTEQIDALKSRLEVITADILTEAPHIDPLKQDLFPLHPHTPDQDSISQILPKQAPNQDFDLSKKSGTCLFTRKELANLNISFEDDKHKLIKIAKHFVNAITVGETKESTRLSARDRDDIKFIKSLVWLLKPTMALAMLKSIALRAEMFATVTIWGWNAAVINDRHKKEEFLGSNIIRLPFTHPFLDPSTLTRPYGIFSSYNITFVDGPDI